MVLGLYLVNGGLERNCLIVLLIEVNISLRCRDVLIRLDVGVVGF